VLQTLFSGITARPFGTFAALMLPIHLVIGVIEGIVSAAILCFVYKMRPEIIDDSMRPDKRLGGVSTKKLLIALVALTIVVGGALSLFVSENPDGLEWAIGKTTEKVLGVEMEPEAGGGIFDVAASLRERAVFLPDYAFASDPENAAGTSVSGIVGAAITFIFAGTTGFAISRVKKRKKAGANV
jgi:cobalt/nickel transport system permease protein